MLRLLRKWLKAGVIENGNWSQTLEGTPQGGLCAAAHNEPCGAPSEVPDHFPSSMTPAFSHLLMSRKTR